jgi:hypothetical protein
MPTIEVLAVAPDLPVDDLLVQPEGGPAAALRALAVVLPGSAFEHVHTGTWAVPGQQPPDALLVSTFGETTMFLGTPVGQLTVPPGTSTFSLSYQTVSMAYGIDVSGPRFHRMIALSPGVLDHAEGAPLPFEAAFSEGMAEANATYSFDDGGFAAAAGEWMFGCQPLDPRPEDRVHLGGLPLHVFSAAPTQVPPEPSDGRHRPSALRGLFRRS